MTDAQRDRIIDDLLLKRPTAKGCTYTDEENYDPRRARYRTLPVPNLQAFGYTDAELFRLGFKYLCEVETYVKDRFYNGMYNSKLTKGQRGGVSRKANRIWERIDPAIRRLIKRGDCGVYEIKSSIHGDYIGCIHAVDKDTAIHVAKTMFGYLVSNVEKIAVKIIEITDDLTAVIERNAHIIKALNSAIDRRSASVKDLSARIETDKARLHAISIVNGQITEAVEAAAK